MIKDNIKNAEIYSNLNGKIKKALEYLKNTDLKSLENKRYDIQGDDVYILIQEYQTKQAEGAKLESHKKYIDVQFIIRGEEKIGFTSIESLKVFEKYDDSRDIMFFEETPLFDFITLKEGDFAVFYPQDAHMPGIHADLKTPVSVKKGVIKIKL